MSQKDKLFLLTIYSYYFSAIIISFQFSLLYRAGTTYLKFENRYNGSTGGIFPYRIPINRYLVKYPEFNTVCSIIRRRYR